MRLEDDVDLSEEAVLWLLEGWAPNASDSEEMQSWQQAVATGNHPALVPELLFGVGRGDDDAASGASQGQDVVGAPPQPCVLEASPPPSPPQVEETATTAAATLSSTVHAAKRRVRGPTLTEQRLRAARDAEKANAECERLRELKRAESKRGRMAAPGSTARRRGRKRRRAVLRRRLYT